MAVFKLQVINQSTRAYHISAKFELGVVGLLMVDLAFFLSDLGDTEQKSKMKKNLSNFGNIESIKKNKRRYPGDKHIGLY